MEKVRGAWLRVQALFRRKQFERDLQDELAFHLAMREQRHRHNGMNDSQAQTAARKEFGNVTHFQEKTRTLWTFTSLETWWADIRYAVRMLRKSPVVTFVVVLSLALGIGANTAMFSVINAAMLKSLPVPEPQRLQLFTWTAKAWPEQVLNDLEGTSRDIEGLSWSYSFSSDFFDYVRDHSQTFENIFAFSANAQKENIGLTGHADSAVVQAVSGDFFSGLRLVPERGRLFTRADDTKTAPRVAMVSYNFWRSRMGQDSNAAGKTITIDGQLVTVVGVLPRDFYGIQPGSPPDIWITLSQYVSASLMIDSYDVSEPKVWWLGIIGRTKPDVSAEQARAELRVLFDQNVRAHNPKLPTDAIIPAIEIESAARGLDNVRHQFSNSLFLLMGMVGLVLLIACANVAALLLARATARQREIAVRLSLGAARRRVIRQLLTESLMLALIGAATGLVIARYATAGLLAMLSYGRNAIDLPVAMDTHVLLFTAAIAIGCGLLFGVAPAVRVMAVDVFPVLKQSQSQVLHGGHKFLPGKVLVGGQVALCLMLLICAGLLARTLRRLQHVNLGFDPHHLIAFTVQPGLNGYKGVQLMSYYSDVQQRLQAIPGVSQVGLSQLGPIGSGQSTMQVALPGYTDPKKEVLLQRHLVGGDYFSDLHIPVLLGRAVGDRDTEASPLVAVVNQSAVTKYFHGDNPIGHTIDFGEGKDHTIINIVGVVGDVKCNDIRDQIRPTAYFAYRQKPEFAPLMTFLVRASGDERTVMSDIPEVAAAVNKDVPVLNLRTEIEIINRALMMERLLALLSSLFAGLALLLACVGLYGTIGYTVVRRTNEIGIRMALGAARENILAMVLRETFKVVFAGLIVGLPLVWFGTRLLKAQLFELSPHDPATIGFSIAAIVLVTLVSGFLPARRASRVDPMVALRCE